MTDRDQTFATNLEYYKSFYYVALWGTITAAADDFYAFLQTDAVMDIFESYLFVSNLEG